MNIHEASLAVYREPSGRGSKKASPPFAISARPANPRWIVDGRLACAACREGLARTRRSGADRVSDAIDCRRQARNLSDRRSWTRIAKKTRAFVDSLKRKSRGSFICLPIRWVATPMSWRGSILKPPPPAARWLPARPASSIRFVRPCASCKMTRGISFFPKPSFEYAARLRLLIADRFPIDPAPPLDKRMMVDDIL